MNDSILVKVDVIAPMPLMHPDAATRFNKLREVVRDGCGVDFLAKCGDICRPAGFRSTKDGVAMRSWHKTGRAFDYNQESKNLVVVPETISGRQYFRTYLKCFPQDGSLGKQLTVSPMGGGRVTAFLFDFTAAAENIGFHRIPAWNGWQRSWNRREFWHYQFDQGLTWDAAMLQIRGKSRPVSDQVIGLNDRGENVRVVQTKLADLGFLPKSEIDGVFGAKSKAAVEKFQTANGLSADGLVGPATKAKLFGQK